jgi:uncharacterized membrane protein YphA (DoxX/SURF4 family)
MNAPAGGFWNVALRWLIGVVLVWAALGKLANLHEFFTALLAYRLPLPLVLTKIAAIVLPWLELLCGLLLLANHKTSAALAWSLVLFAGFTLAIGHAWVRGLHIACGCLDLQLIGIRRESGLGAFLESMPFAFFRALALASAAAFLFTRAVRREENP